MITVEIIHDDLVRVTAGKEEFFATRHPAIDGGFVWCFEKSGVHVGRALRIAIEGAIANAAQREKPPPNAA